MTLGEKLKAARTTAGLSQRELAMKLFVSRQAITKWENDKGVPDVENLRALAELFGVSVDYLLGEGQVLSAHVTREPLELSAYRKSGKARGRRDAAVQARFPNAQAIVPLTRRRKLGSWESVVDFMVQPGVLHAADSLRDRSGYYIVDLGDRDLLVQVAAESMESRELGARFAGRRQVIGENVFTEAPYAL